MADNRQAGLPANTIDIAPNGVNNGRTVMSYGHQVGNAPESVTIIRITHTYPRYESEVNVMEIYIVMEPDMDRYCGSHLHEVFDTMEKAKQYIKDNDIDNYGIEDLNWNVVTKELK